MNQSIRRKHTCETCRYRHRDRCGNVDSDYLGELVGEDMWCMDWTGETRPEHLSNEILLSQLAEECAELIHAIEKFRRTGTGNYTPVSSTEAWMHIIEEVSDVLLSAEIFRRKLPGITNESIEEEMDWKYERWCDRLNDRYHVSDE